MPFILFVEVGCGLGANGAKPAALKKLLTKLFHIHLFISRRGGAHRGRLPPSALLLLPKDAFMQFSHLSGIWLPRHVSARCVLDLGRAAAFLRQLSAAAF